MGTSSTDCSPELLSCRCHQQGITLHVCTEELGSVVAMLAQAKKVLLDNNFGKFVGTGLAQIINVLQGEEVGQVRNT